MSHPSHDHGACDHCHDPHHGGRRAAPAQLLLRLKRVGIRYERNGDWAVHGVDLDIGPGEIVSMIGPNGAGKTSLLRAVAGLQPVTEGSITWSGKGGPAAIGYVPQQQPPDRNLPISVLEFLLLKLGPKSNGGFALWQWLRRSDGGARAKALAGLEEMGVAALASRRLGELSGGQLQRVMIAYSLLGDPKLLLLDEPMTGIDVKGGRDFVDLIAGLRRARGVAVLLVSHDLHMVGSISDVVVCLNRHLCATGTPAQVLQDHVLSGIYGSEIAAPKSAAA